MDTTNTMNPMSNSTTILVSSQELEEPRVEGRMKTILDYTCMGIFFFSLASIITGAVVIPFSFCIAGRYHRTPAICTMDEVRELAKLAGKGHINYRPVWNVSVFAIDDVGVTNPLHSGVAGFEGDLSSLSPRTYKSLSVAQSILANKTAGSLVPCIYPSDPLKYPTGGSVTDTRVVFLGNYSQSQQESAYKKASAIIDAGIGLVVVGTIFGFGIFSYVVYNYHFKQDRPNMTVK